MTNLTLHETNCKPDFEDILFGRNADDPYITIRLVPRSLSGAARHDPDDDWLYGDDPIGRGTYGKDWDDPPKRGRATEGNGLDERPSPYPDAPIAPVMRLLDERLSTSEHEPPMRNIMGQMAMVRVRKPRHPSLHEQALEGAETRLAPPILPLLTEHDETSLAILIERHINFEKVLKTKTGETRIPVSLAPPFVRYYHRYADSTLPVAHAIATMPLILPNGKLIAPRGLDRDLGIIFRIDPKLAAILPRPGSVKCEA